MNHLPRRAEIALLAAGMLILYSPAGAEEAPQTAREKGLVIIGTTDKASDLDPANSYDFHTWEVHWNTMSGLVGYGSDGGMIPALAASPPSVSEDGLTWTVELRQGQKFPSGRELTSRDVKWSVDRVRHLGGKASWLVTSFVESVEVAGPYSVSFVLLKPTSFFPSLLATSPYFPLDQSCYSAYSIDTDSTCGGLGPYLIREWVRDDYLLLEANPDWPGEKAVTKRVKVRYFDSSASLRQALEAGSIDLAWNTLTPDDLIALRADDRMKVWENNSSFKRMLVLTHHVEPFSDPRVRQALSYLVDREALAEEAFKGTFSPLYSPIPNATPGHIDTLPTRDVNKGIALLAEAGYDAERPLRFDLWWTDDHYGDSEVDLASTLKNQLEATGVIQINSRSSHWTTYLDATNECEYPAFLFGWYPDYVDQSTAIDFFALSEATSALCSNYSNPEMDKLVRAAQSESDPNTRARYYNEIQQLWVKDIPTIPLLQGVLFAASRSNLEGVSFEVSAALRYHRLKLP